WARVAMVNPKVKIYTERMSFFMSCIASVPAISDEDPQSRVISWRRSFDIHCSVEKLMHQRPNPIHFFFQREVARVEKMELCTGNISFKELSTLHGEDSIIFAPSDQHGWLLFTEVLLPIGIDIQIPSCVVED